MCGEMKMTTINIYENKENGDIIVDASDIKEIKELLKQLLNETKNINRKLSDNESKDITSIEDVIKATKEQKRKTITSVTPVKNELDKTKSLSDVQKKVLSTLPSFNERQGSNYEKNIIKEYSIVKDKDEFLKDKWTMNRLLGLFDISRYGLEKELWKNNDSLENLGLIKKFRVSPSKKKSPLLFYKIDNNKKKKNTLKKTDKFEVLPVNARKLYTNISLNEDTGEFKFRIDYNNREMSLLYDVYDVLYIKSVALRDTFTMGDFNELLQSKSEWTRITLFRLIYNLQYNDEFNKLLDDFEDNFSNVDFDSKSGLLQIDGEMTYVPLHQAKAWCDFYINNHKSKEELLWSLQRRFREYERNHIACIILNITNNDLNKLWSGLNVKSEFVENNPSKRRNMIKNGVLIK